MLGQWIHAHSNQVFYHQPVLRQEIPDFCRFSKHGQAVRALRHPSEYVLRTDDSNEPGDERAVNRGNKHHAARFQQTATGFHKANQAGHAHKRTDHSKDRAASREGKGSQGFNLEDELNIPEELRDIIEDSDDDFQLRFNDPNELIEIFSTLEENNLLEIQRMQESEQELEVKKQIKKETEANQQARKALLEANKKTNEDRI